MAMEQVILWISFIFLALVLTLMLREDWFHLSRPSRKVMARVIGHDESLEDAHRSYAARFEFTNEDGKVVQILDNVYWGRPLPKTGSIVELTHPRGMPKRARIRRFLPRTAIYLVLFYVFAVLGGRLAGWLNVDGTIATGF